jgi:hypothetical protein
MGLKKDTATRAEGVGYYMSQSDASEVLDYLSADMHNVEPDEPTYHYGSAFKVTVIVEEI